MKFEVFHHSILFHLTGFFLDLIQDSTVLLWIVTRFEYVRIHDFDFDFDS